MDSKMFPADFRKTCRSEVHKRSDGTVMNVCTGPEYRSRKTYEKGVIVKCTTCK